ncbi:MAG: hypothetical protein HY900_30010 [Deltaproteobacteria bacterium]|nr:hypothetical protein [Deltaproteobacteria bacterium]
MDAVTYPNASVTTYITHNVVPLRIPSNHESLAPCFRVQWTPTLLFLDPEGTEHHRSVGFLPAEELVPWLLIGSAKWRFNTNRPELALHDLEEILSSYPKSDFAPEALYLTGVCRYKTTHDPKPLKEAYEKLKVEHPGSEWEKRAYPYSLL